MNSACAIFLGVRFQYSIYGSTNPITPLSPHLPADLGERAHGGQAHGLLPRGQHPQHAGHGAAVRQQLPRHRRRVGSLPSGSTQGVVHGSSCWLEDVSLMCTGSVSHSVTAGCPTLVVYIGQRWPPPGCIRPQRSPWAQNFEGSDRNSLQRASARVPEHAGQRHGERLVVEV